MTTQNVYLTTKTAFTWKGSGGDAVLSMTSVANGAGRLGGRLDLGAFPKPGWYRLFAEMKPQATPTVGNLIRIYLAHWNDDSTPAWADGAVGSADAAFATENDLKNLKLALNLRVENASSRLIRGSGLVYIPTRYVSPVVWNASGAALTTTATDHFIAITPIVDDIQAAA